MLSNQHFYHRVIRKMVIAFGNMFNNIKLVRYTQDGLTEIERINVPISYSNKEKFYKRITEDPNLANQTLTVLPRMAFEMAGLSYDPLRKISSHLNLYDNEGTTTGSKFKWTPYNFDFNLSIFVRNTEDGTQIIEQILPYFTPDYTVTIDFLNMDNLKLDVPIVFNSVTYNQDYDGLPDITRTLTWDLNFTMKGYLFGPISTVKVIKKVTANVYNDLPFTGTQKFNMSSGFGNYKQGELVYQGSSLDNATAKAFVREWANTSNTLFVYESSGTFSKNTAVTGVVSHAKYTLNTYEYGSQQLVNITVEPDPTSANVESDYGFTQTIEEYPNIT